MAQPKEVAHLILPTWAGEFDLRVFEGTSGDVYLLFVYGEIGDGQDLLVRLHSACLTGDAFGSLRCDCGPQLHLAMRQIVAEGRGALVYAVGHEGEALGSCPSSRPTCCRTRATTPWTPTAGWACRSTAATTERPCASSRPLGSEAPACSPTTPQRRVRWNGRASTSSAWYRCRRPCTSATAGMCRPSRSGSAIEPQAERP